MNLIRSLCNEDVLKYRKKLNNEIDKIIKDNEEIEGLIKKNSIILSNKIIRFLRRILSTIFCKKETKIEDIRKNKKIIF